MNRVFLDVQPAAAPRPFPAGCRQGPYDRDGNAWP
jgi:hypothetical protein